jgi:preprotein translocase subunit SecF
MRLKLVKENTEFNFFKRWKVWIGLSAILIVFSIVSTMIVGLNFGIDFKGGTTIRAESGQPIEVGAYRSVMEPLQLGDISIAEVFDPTFRSDQYVVQIRIQTQDGQEAVSSNVVIEVQKALRNIAPDITFPSVESVGPKVSGELIEAAVWAVLIAMTVVLIYIWLRFEWQFAVGAVGAILHDIILTIGVFAILQIKFDLAIIAALLTIVGYSLNDTVVVFDRVRENLRRYKKKQLAEVLNLSINETLSRTVMTSFTTLLALLSLFVLGGDVIRGFVFAMIWGVLVGTYSSVFVASSTLLSLGVKRDWSKPNKTDGNQFAKIDN